MLLVLIITLLQCLLVSLDTSVLQVYVGGNVNRTDILLLIGAIYYQLGNYKQCIAFNDRCIMLDPHMAEAHANLANALQQLSNFDMAMIYYQVDPDFTLSKSRGVP